MATTTPNFGWSVPTSTDYVKDGAVAIETLGDAIDASLVDLKGGTTGQVLSKNTNTDMDFTWVTPNDADAIQNTIVDAKGDLITATASDTPARLGVGSNGQVLAANSSTSTGLEWQTISTGGMTLLSTTSISGTSTTVSSISQNYTHLFISLEDLYAASGTPQLRFANTASHYWVRQWINSSSAAETASNGTAATNQIDIGGLYTGTSFKQSFGIWVYNYANTATFSKTGEWGGATRDSQDRIKAVIGGFMYSDSTNAINSVTILTSGGTSGGTMKIYGVK